MQRLHPHGNCPYYLSKNRRFTQDRNRSQSSEQAGGVASRAIDGNYNAAYPGGSVTHTSNAEATGWWQVDLGTLRPVNEVKLFNRSDCCADRLSNFRVSIFDGGTEVWGEDYFTDSG